MINTVMLITISQGRNVTESKLCHIYFITQHNSVTMQLQSRTTIPNHIIQGYKKIYTNSNT